MLVYGLCLMIDLLALLTVLQHGDSFFPSGGFASSWGLETLCAEGRIRDATNLAQFIKGQLRYRWARCDRPALLFTYRAGEDLERVAKIDEELEALSLPRDLREASRRAGRALLRVHARLGARNAADYLTMIKAGTAYGHTPVAQGLVWRNSGIDQTHASALSGHIFCVACVSAAVRLGMINHIEAQHVLQQTCQILTTLIQLPPPEQLSSFTPAVDIAMLRHEAQAVRLFAN